jgi:hypothetical protein
VFQLLQKGLEISSHLVGFPASFFETVVGFFSNSGSWIFLKIYSINLDTHIVMSTYLYEHIHIHPTFISTSERPSQFDLEIHEVGHQDRLIVDGDIASH